MASLAILIVSIPNEPHWLRPCLRSVFEHAGDIALDVVVADNCSTDGTRELVQSEFPQARVVTCVNLGFAHGNNSAYFATTAPNILYLNPDTEILRGTFADLVTEFERRPEVGLVGVRQLLPNGELHPTIRRFPTVRRIFFDSIAGERLPLGLSNLGIRETDLSRYQGEVSCDWTSGSFMLVRRSAIQAAGLLDERFFLYLEETDLCLRIRQAGWQIRHLPHMIILHHANKGGVSERMASQNAFAWRQYMRKHFTRSQRIGGMAALALHYGLRAILSGRDSEVGGARRRAARASLATLIGRRKPPFGEPPKQALVPRADVEAGKVVGPAAG
jgi:GT2 family glycosyltransferase